MIDCEMKALNRLSTLKRGVLAVALSHFLIFSISQFLISCGDDDDLNVPELIVGTWVVDSYEVLDDSNTEYTIEVDRFEFRSDNTFTVYYMPWTNSQGELVTGDTDSGTYEAGEAYLRLEYRNDQGEVQKVLCEIISFTETTMQLTYRHPDSDIVAHVKVKKK